VTAVVVREPVSDDGAAEPAARRVGLEDFAAFSEQVGERESGESAPEDAERILKLRRALASRPSRNALRQLTDLVNQYPTNREFLAVIAP